jgi:hypothetical protein
MSYIKTGSIQNNENLRQAIYQGKILHFPANRVSEQLISEVLVLLEDEIKDPIRQAQFRFSNEDFFYHIGKLRKLIYTQPNFQNLVKELMLLLNFELEKNAFEPIRLRVVTHKGHENPKAAPIYYGHRDTWYSHSQALITWWIPLHDVKEEETFVFYPNYFDKPVKNGSSNFNYDKWINDQRQLTIGWQDVNAGKEAYYPNLMQELDKKDLISFSAKRGEILLFSGACLHQTRNNVSGLTRFSLDFRTVHLNDHKENVGAPNVDNFSSGSAMQQYIYP